MKKKLKDMKTGDTFPAGPPYMEGFYVVLVPWPGVVPEDSNVTPHALVGLEHPHTRIPPIVFTGGEAPHHLLETTPPELRLVPCKGCLHKVDIDSEHYMLFKDGVRCRECLTATKSCGWCGKLLELPGTSVRCPEAPNPMHGTCAREWDREYWELLGGVKPSVEQPELSEQEVQEIQEVYRKMR